MPGGMPPPKPHHHKPLGISETYDINTKLIAIE